MPHTQDRKQPLLLMHRYPQIIHPTAERFSPSANRRPLATYKNGPEGPSLYTLWLVTFSCVLLCLLDPEDLTQRAKQQLVPGQHLHLQRPQKTRIH